MPTDNPDNSVARKVELAVSRQETLSILPGVAASFLTQLSRMELTPSSLAELIRSDPSLTTLALRLCNTKGIIIRRSSTWLQQVTEGLSLREIRDAVLSAKVYPEPSEDPRADFRIKLTRHSLAVACCAEMLAQLEPVSLDESGAYLAGLLHDVGKFSLEEAMPKSFDALLEQAKTTGTSLYKVEQENLGIDHTILGKRIAQKLHLPSDVILGIWLHHSQTCTVAQAMPHARIAALVELANCVVRQLGIGESGSYDEVSSQRLSTSIGLTVEQMEQVKQRLPGIVMGKSEIAGLGLPGPGRAYRDALRVTAGELAGESSRLFDENSRLQNSASHFAFVREVLPKITSTTTAIEFAQAFAAGWQRFYQTGPVCIYLPDESGANTVEAVVAENQTEIKTMVLDVPEGTTLVPRPAYEEFVVLDAADYADWLLEQIDVEFDLARTKLAPLRSGGRTAGVILFELRHPAEGDAAQRFGPAAQVGGIALDMLKAIGRQQWYAERFAQLLTSGGQKTEDRRQKTEDRGRKTEDRPFFAEATKGEGQRTDAEALTEMAAGAAHELNNPLSVISGRAQLLAKSETDAEKKRILEQIKQNADELSTIIDDLMGYASPEKPRPTQTAIRQIIDEAIDLASRKTRTDRADMRIDIEPDTPDVVVDSAQIACAISNIICNGIESYEQGAPDKDIRGKAGSIVIKAGADKTHETVSMQVTDSGCGMDEQTLFRATQPFFSSRPAGRKRGMGLAHAQRLIEINNGKLEIASQPGKGTTVTVKLPCK